MTKLWKRYPVKLDIIRFDKDAREAFTDIVSEEIPLTVHINGTEIFTILASPPDLEELSVGFLFTAGMIRSIDDIRSVTIDRKNWISSIELKRNIDFEFIFKRIYTPGCGKGVLFYNVLDILHRKPLTSRAIVKGTALSALMKEFLKRSVEFKKTGCEHSAALADESGVIIYKEDIGRHNAVDKVIGEAVMKRVRMADRIVFVSGRVSSEIVLKVKKSGCPFLVSRSAPTDQAVKFARDFRLTLIGFARGERMNIYSENGRVA
ncbi:MAG: formate dehydrogenase accessory sulfurtransferase FdhD [Candidatus Omnitrophota bacterium]